MKISRLIEELTRVKKSLGDVEVTCTASTLPDNHPGSVSGPGDIIFLMYSKAQWKR